MRRTSSILPLTFLMLTLFSGCRTTPPEMDQRISAGENRVTEESKSYSLGEIRVNPQGEIPPFSDRILRRLLPGGPLPFTLTEPGYYWSVKPRILSMTEPDVYPLYLPDFYKLGYFWYLLLTEVEKEGRVNRMILPLGENPQLSDLDKIQPLRDENKPLIILDPGHGGKDPGAVGANRLYEKMYNQRLSIGLKNELEERGFTVLFTYDPESDSGASLEERVQFSNYYRQALFISLHHNSSYNSSDRGFSIFFSSYSENEDSEHAYVMVDGEKKPFLKQTVNGNTIYLYYEEENSVKRISLPLNDPYADTFVRDHRITERARDSFELALTIHDNLNHLDWLQPYSYNHRLIDERDYRVLNNNPNASVIVECGFLSNPDEAELLNREENIMDLVQALADAVESYSSSTGRLAALSLK